MARRAPSRRRHRTIVCALVALAAAGAGCGNDGNDDVDDDQPAPTTAQLPNPASLYCEEQGGRVEIVDEPDGQRGDCVFPDGRRIDEWELYRSGTGATSVP
jgi:putative hemolysin